MANKEVVVHVTIDPRFTRLLVRQNDIQMMILGEEVSGMAPDKLADYIRTQSLALMAEVIEVLDEAHWKPWAKRPADEDVIPHRERWKGEIADVFIFTMNLMLAGGMSMMELAQLVDAKQTKNIARQLAGYDGKGSKCPQCKGAYDDNAVKCTPDGWCVKTGNNFS
jgi:hypothetical protein